MATARRKDKDTNENSWQRYALGVLGAFLLAGVTFVIQKIDFLVTQGATIARLDVKVQGLEQQQEKLLTQALDQDRQMASVQKDAAKLQWDLAAAQAQTARERADLHERLTLLSQRVTATAQRVDWLSGRLPRPQYRPEDFQPEE